jgi:hypothetical protein
MSPHLQGEKRERESKEVDHTERGLQYMSTCTVPCVPCVSNHSLPRGEGEIIDPNDATVGSFSFSLIGKGISCWLL